MNKAMLIGNLTRDPEVRTFDSTKAVCNFTIAVNRRRKVEGQPDADFFNIQAWGKLGENCAKYLAKGRKCAVTGQVQIRTYSASDGTKRTAVDIVADDVEFLPNGDGQRSGQTQASPPPPTAQDGFVPVEDELPF